MVKNIMFFARHVVLQTFDMKPQPCKAPPNYDMGNRMNIKCSKCGKPICFHNDEVYSSGNSFVCLKCKLK